MRVSLIAVGILLHFAACGFARQHTPATQPSNPRATPEQLQLSLERAKPGDVVQTPFRDTKAMKPVEFLKAARRGEAEFLLSDKPEYFRTGDGIAMQETVSTGRVRLYLYHVPEPTGAKKTISAVIENLGKEPMRLDFERYGSPKPSGDYHNVAREALFAYFNRTPAPEAFAKRVIPPGGRAVIDPHIDGLSVSKDILVHVLHEFRINQPARITVFQRDPAADSLTVIDTLPKLPRVLPGFNPSGAGRGLFDTAHIDATNAPIDFYDTASGPGVFIIADGKTDPWIEGRDSIDPSSPIQNKGNYGVMYRVQLRYKSTDRKRVAVLMTGHRPDNHGCKYTSSVIEINSGYHPGGVVGLPTTGKRFANLPQAVVMQTYPAAPAGQHGEIVFTYSPPGACCLPTPILLIPL